MADKRHIARIRQGVDVWNNWRKENPTLNPNFRKAILNEADLNGAWLRKANLHRTNLRETDLRKAHLRT